jgi:probable selenium-dependent hydroxylase accessory protein YqeC
MDRTLIHALDIHPKEVVSLVGAGGKTTLMFALAHELATRGAFVVTSTTTKIFPPASSVGTSLFLSEDEAELVDLTLKSATGKRPITIASQLLPDSGKLRGISPSLVSRLIKLRPVSCIIIEADGASGKPLKAPNPDYEPVIPPCTTLLVPVVGIDALGCGLSEENVFRSQIAATLTGLRLGEPISKEAIVDLIVHPLGIMTGCPQGARAIPFINKMDLNIDRLMASDLALGILAANHPQIDRVVLGQAQAHPPVVEVIFRQ